MARAADAVGAAVSRHPVTRRTWLALAAIVSAAAALRFWNLAAGLPYSVGVDEPEIMERVVHMMKTGDFNPHFFDWPSLTFYLQLVVACTAFLLGAMHGAWSSLADVGASDLYVYARALTATIGTASVLLMFWAARRWGAETGTALVAAALLAIFPNHVRESHFVLTDVPMTCLTTLSLLLAIRAEDRPSSGAFAAAGLVVGLAASTKYNGLVAIVLPMIAAVAAGGPALIVVQRILIVCGTAVAGFLAATPYAVADLPKFLSDFANLAGHFSASQRGEAGWSIYLKYLWQGLGSVGFVLAAIGLGLSLVRSVAGPGRARGLYLVIFPLLYFRMISTSSQMFARYALPLLPFAALLIALAATAAWTRARRHLSERARMAALAIGLFVLAAKPLTTSIGFDRLKGQEGTIGLAYRWIENHVPPGAVIVSETHPAFLTSTHYRITNIKPLSGQTFAQYLGGRVDYVLVSSAGYDPAFKSPTEYADAHAAYVTVFNRARELATFAPSDTVSGPTLKLLQIREPAEASAP